MGLCSSRPKCFFVPDNSIVGQGEDAKALFEKLGFTNREIHQLYHKFRQIDKDWSHEIELSEFYDYFNLSSTPFADKTFLILDTDESGSIDFKEFVIAYWNFCTINYVNLGKFAFSLYDSDHSGSLDTREIVELIKAVYGYKAYEENKRVQSILSKLDANGDGVVTLSEFLSFNKAHPLLLYPAWSMQKQLRRKVLGDKWWSEVAKRRDKDFRSSNIYQILAEMSDDNFKQDFEKVFSIAEQERKIIPEKEIPLPKPEPGEMKKLSYVKSVKKYKVAHAYDPPLPGQSL